jgi:hypothetical protein
VKPTAWCSKKCRQSSISRRKRDKRVSGSDPRLCKCCGVTLPEKPWPLRGRRKAYCSSDCVKEWRQKQAAAVLTKSCATCGTHFATHRGQKYCSAACKYPLRQCASCGKMFAPGPSDRKSCSDDCAKGLMGYDAKVYRCLYCGEPFTRRRYASGSSSKGTKYCCRNHAFAARKERLPCAHRPLDAAIKCRKYLDQWRKERDRRIAEESLRWAPQPKPARSCRVCGAERKRGKRLCGSCSALASRESTRKSKRRRRQLHGGDSYRARCRRSGAPYTSFRKVTVYERDGWTCQMCGVELLRKYLRTNARVDPRSPTLDHVIPIALGACSPGHVPSNVQAACFDCNSRKGASLPDSFAPAARNKLL